MMKSAYIILENGEVFKGKGLFGEQEIAVGEVVFTTGMCGYMESLTDPSFARQILVFTYPLIGNYGIADPTAWESAKAQVAGVIINENCTHWSHHTGLLSLQEWLAKESIPLLTEVDTRALTKILRQKGTLRGIITQNPQEAVRTYPSEHNLVSEVTICQKRVYGSGKKRVIVVDCGMKESMIRQLAQFPIEIVRVPYDYDYLHEPFDAVFLSNGPGDPTTCTKTITILQHAMKMEKPIFGVCLGAQLLALAAGAKTYKLPFGHRGQNQPCLELRSQKCYITSQNHGFAIDEATLPSNWEVTFRNLNDGSVEGIAHKYLPFYSVQFHPEAAPGPTDTQWFFERFWQCLLA